MLGYSPGIEHYRTEVWTEMSEIPKPKSLYVRWAVITKTGRVVVEAETAEAAREKVERRGYLVLEVNLDASDQPISF